MILRGPACCYGQQPRLVFSLVARGNNQDLLHMVTMETKSLATSVKNRHPDPMTPYIDSVQ